MNGDKDGGAKNAAKSYVDAQLNILREHGSIELSDKKYRSLIRKVEAVTSA